MWRVLDGTSAQGSVSSHTAGGGVCAAEPGRSSIPQGDTARREGEGVLQCLQERRGGGCSACRREEEGAAAPARERRRGLQRLQERGGGGCSACKREEEGAAAPAGERRRGLQHLQERGEGVLQCLQERGGGGCSACRTPGAGTAATPVPLRAAAAVSRPDTRWPPQSKKEGRCRPPGAALCVPVTLHLPTFLASKLFSSVAIGRV